MSRAANPFVAVELVVRCPLLQYCGKAAGEFEGVLKADVQRRSACVEDVRCVAGQEGPAEPIGIGLAAVADGAADGSGLGERQFCPEDSVEAAPQLLDGGRAAGFGSAARLMGAD